MRKFNRPRRAPAQMASTLDWRSRSDARVHDLVNKYHARYKNALAQLYERYGMGGKLLLTVLII